MSAASDIEQALAQLHLAIMKLGDLRQAVDDGEDGVNLTLRIEKIEDLVYHASGKLGD